MFSNSNSYLGGANTGRTYGQQPFGSQQQSTNNFPGQQPGYGGGLQPQPTGFGGGLQPQPTGFGGGIQPQQTGFGGGIQPQQTGFGPGMQQQYTGFQGQQQQQQQPQTQQYTGYPNPQPQQIQPQATGFPVQQSQQPLQSQYTGFPTQNTSSFQQQSFPQSSTPSPAPRQQSQPTGMTSSQVADSFRGTAAKQSTPQPITSTSNKIPKVRLSFITASDQSKFEQLFQSAAGSEQSLSGDQARDLLLRSKLPGDTLSHIWTLSDTTKSGRLLFPEFALSMYLCNIALVGKQLPSRLPDTITNEVSSMVDRISFSVPDEHSSSQSTSNAPNFNDSGRSAQAQQPQPTSGQLLSQLMSQPTGYQQQPQSFQPQPTGIMPQQTGFMNSPQATGYGSQRPLQPMATGYGNPASIAPLNSQPTGRPGQWGLVNAPASGLPNMQALQSQMMPQQGREGGFTSTGLRGNATVPWAVTKDEKKIYDNLFKAWDGFGKGFITGNQAIEIFGQSGLDKPDLERIWTLSDPSNRGRLDLDEFAVAMHLIYRKLNGYPVPARLPPELIPPSTRNLNASLTGIKSLLSRDAEERKSSGAFLEPQKTGVSYLKNHSFSGTSGNASGGRKDATVYRNNDDDVGYKSTARRRLGADGRSESPDTASPPPEPSDDLSLDQLRKKVREKQVLLDAIDFQDENQASQDEALDRKDKKDADEFFRRIRNMQEDIDKHPNSAFRTGDSDAERRTLRRQLQGLTDKLPEIASQVRRAERAIADAQLELFRLKDAKLNPSTASAVVGTGPGGAVTESDRLKARAKAMMQQRAAALSGKTIAADNTDTAGATRRMEEESARVRAEKDNNDRMVKDIEESVNMFSKGVEEGLKEGGQDEQSEHERRRWEDGLGVEDEVKDFIFDLQRSSRSARVRREDDVRKPRDREVASPKSQSRTDSANQSPATTAEAPSRPAAAASSSSYASYKTAEERAAFIKQQAEARMAERLAALGLRPPPKAAETANARQERERNEKEERLRQAEAEDAKREQERQRRLADEQITPPSASKKPPPPPSRNGRAGSVTKQNEVEKALKEKEEVQQAEVHQLEDETHRQEEELRREREASDARRKALEEQVKQGKMKKEEEKRRRQASQKDTKEKEDRLTAQRAELEAARAREEELQRQLQALENDDSSDEDGPQHFTPSDSTANTSQELSRDATSESQTAPPAPPPMPPVPAPSTVTSPPAETNNPFFRKMQSNTEQAAPSSAAAPSDTNPFHRMTTAQSTTTSAPPSAADRGISSPAPTRASRLATSKAEDDDWSVVESEDSSDDDDDPAAQPTGAGNARNLASILFGSMGPPRPMSGMSSNGPSSPAPVSSPPPPPPMPGSFEPVAPSPLQAPSTPGGFSFGAPPPAPPPPPPPMPGSAAPPPPPMPSSGAPPPPAGAPPAPGLPPPPMPSAGGGGMPMPFGRGGLLGEIQAGKGLRKVQTKDKSTAGSAGRVLN